MAEQESLLNSEIIEQLQFLAEDDANFVCQLIETMDKEMSYFMEHIEQWLHQSDYSTISKVAHKMTGATSNLGAAKLAKITQSIEYAAKSSDGNLIKEHLVQLSPVLSESMTQLKEIFSAPEK